MRRELMKKNGSMMTAQTRTISQPIACTVRALLGPDDAFEIILQCYAKLAHQGIYLRFGHVTLCKTFTIMDNVTLISAHVFMTH
jgi:hypothetical protein